MEQIYTFCGTSSLHGCIDSLLELDRTQKILLALQAPVGLMSADFQWVLALSSVFTVRGQRERE